MNTTPRVALVTGAARGIGLATAQWFLQHGHAVALLDIDAVTLHAAVAALAGRLGIADWTAGALPAEKAALVEFLKTF